MEGLPITLVDEHLIEPNAFLTRLHVDVGMTVADFGVGRDLSLLMTAAHKITSTGIAYALDVVKDLLSIIEERVTMDGLTNVQTVWTDLEIYGAARTIADNSVDVGWLVTTLYMSQKKEAMIKECLRMIKPGGTLAIADWKPQATPIGPAVEYRFAPKIITDIAPSLGLQLQEEFEAGEYHWGLVFQKRS